MIRKSNTNVYKRLAISSASVFLTIMAVVAMGFLSFAGFYLLIPSVLMASVSMVLASIIEFTVIYDNISGAFNKLFQQDHLKEVLVERLVRELIKNRIKDQKANGAVEKLDFVQDYLALRQHIHHLKHHQNHTQHGELEEAEQMLSQMLGLFKRYVFGTGNVPEQYKKEFDQFMSQEQRDALHLRYQGKYQLSNYVIIPVMIAALSCGFVTYTTISLSLVELLPALQFLLPGIASVSVASLAPAIAAVSTFAGVAYFLQIFNSTCDIIYKDSFHELWRDIRSHVGAEDKKSILYGLGVSGLVALSLFVNVATAATWWAAVAGMPFAYVNMMSVSIYATAQMAFNLENTHRTLEQLKTLSMDNTTTWLRDACRSALANEHWLQLINPFRFMILLVKVPFRTLSFLGHVFSIGVTMDNFWNRWVSAVAASFSELFEDWHYIMDFGGHHHGHGHHHTNLLDDDTHNHNHVDILGWVFLAIAFVPLILPSMLVDWGASQLNTDCARRLSFGEAWDRALGRADVDSTPHAHHKPVLSELWQGEIQNLARLAAHSSDYESATTSYPSDVESSEEFGSNDTRSSSTGTPRAGDPRFFRSLTDGCLPQNISGVPLPKSVGSSALDAVGVKNN